MRYVMIDKQTLKVVNAIELDPRAIDYSGPVTDDLRPWSAPSNITIVQSDAAEIGQRYVDGVFV